MRDWKRSEQPAMMEPNNDPEFYFGFAVDWIRRDLGSVTNEAGLNSTHRPVTAFLGPFCFDMQVPGGHIVWLIPA